MTTRTRILIFVTAILFAMMTAAIGTAAPPGQENQTATTISATGTAAYDVTIRAQTHEANIANATQNADIAPVRQILRQQAHDAGGRIHLWTEQHIITSDAAGVIKIWDAETVELIASLDFGFELMDSRLGDPTSALQLNADETRLLAWNTVDRECACDLTVNVWNIDAESDQVGELLFSITHDDPTDFVGNSGAKWNPDETMIAGWSRDGHSPVVGCRYGRGVGHHSERQHHLGRELDGRQPPPVNVVGRACGAYLGYRSAASTNGRRRAKH